MDRHGPRHSNETSSHDTSRRDALKTIAVGSAGVLGSLTASGSAAASTQPASVLDGGGGQHLDMVTDGSKFCETPDKWSDKWFIKGELGQCVALVDVQDNPYGSGNIYYFNAATTASYSGHKPGTIWPWEERKWTDKKFCSEIPANSGYETLQTFIRIENANANVGLQIPDGSIGVGGSPRQLLFSKTQNKRADTLGTVFKAAMGQVPMINHVLTVNRVVDSFEVADTDDIGDNEHLFEWKFGDWFNAPDGFDDSDYLASNGFVQFGIRAPRGVTPRFTIRNKAIELAKETLVVKNTFEASNQRLTTMSQR